MAGSVHQLWSLGLVKSSEEELLWAEQLRDPLHTASLHSERKFTMEPVWINTCSNPSWVLANSQRRGSAMLTQAPHVEVFYPPKKPSPYHTPPCKDEHTTIVASLRACAKSKDLHGGIKLHEDILAKGLLEKCSDALVTMYAKCGALAKAKELLDMHKSKRVFAWTALISEYAARGQGKDALHFFECMQHEGISPDAVTYACALKACGIIKAADKGEQFHNDIAKRGLLENNVVLCTALVDMYAKCGVFAKARHVLEEYSNQNVASWNALIAGYAQQEQGEQALNCFERMQHENVSPDAITFACILKACGSIGAVDKGEQIHEEILRQGLLGKDVVLGTALVDMYVKCGRLTKAQGVLEKLHSRNVVSWNALIAGYSQLGHGEKILSCFDWMQREGLSPDAVTFICILKACSISKRADKGEQIHDEIVRQGLLENNGVLGNAIVDMYAKCGALKKALKVFEELPSRDVVSWNILIGGYAQWDQGEQAVNYFKRMQVEGFSPDAVTYACTLKACGTIGAADKGEEIHDIIARQGLLENNVVLGTALVDMYAKCGALVKAQKVLETLSHRDVVTWNALITGYVQRGQSEQALDCFERMQHEGLSPNEVTFTCILKACITMGYVDKVEEIHMKLTRRGLLGNDILLGTALVDTYAKCGALEKAGQMLQELPSRDVVAWSALIAGHAQEGQGERALTCYDLMQREGFSPDAVTFACILKACGTIGAVEKGIKIHNKIATEGLLENSAVLGTALVDMYAKCGALEKARRVLEQLPVRDAISWNALIAGYVQQGEGAQALNCYEQMRREGLSPDSVTFICIFKACGSTGASEKGEEIHEEVAKQGLLVNDVLLGTSLADMYAKCGALAKAQQVLEELRVRDVISWNTLIAGFVRQGRGEQALNCFEQMQRQGLSPDAMSFVCIFKACGSLGAADKGEEFHDEIAKQGLLENNIVLSTALVDMYAKCGALTKARRVFEELPVRDVVAWNALIAGYVQQGECVQALNCFEQMLREGHAPAAVTYMCILKACGSIGAAEKGEKVHDEIAKQGLLENDIVLGTALVDMYAKCGALVKAREVLEELPVRNVTAWNALIAGSVQQGDGEQAMSFFDRMEHEGLLPGPATFSCVLSACSRLGLVADAQMHFVNMSTKYGMNPDLQHYTCMIDLFGRTGHLDKAVRVLEKLPSSNRGIWSALLGACHKWGDVNVGRWAFERAVQVDKSDAGIYTLMANIYAAAGLQGDAKDIQAMRVKNKAEKKHKFSAPPHLARYVSHVAPHDVVESVEM